MDTHIDNEPTCFVKMLHDFRTDSIPGRRISALGFPGLGLPDSQNAQNAKKPVKLVFDDSVLNETENSYNKKRKIQGDTPDSHKINDSFMASPWETRKMKADLTEARAEIARLESRISQMETVHKENTVFFEQEKRSLQQSLEKERYSNKEIEQRLRALRKQKAEAKQELLECQANLRQEVLNSEEKYQILFQEHVLLKDKFSELDCNSGDKVLQLERKLSATEQHVADIKEELNSNKELLSKLRTELNEKLAESRMWELDKVKLNAATQRVKELEYEQESHQSAILKAQTQQSKLLRLFDLEKEVSSLKEENKNLRQAITDKLCLEGKVEDLRSRLSVLKKREEEIVSLKVELGVSQTRLQEWTELSNHILGQSSASPISLRKFIENLQKTEIVLTDENSKLKSTVKKLEASQNEYLAESQLLRAQIVKLKLNIEQNNLLIKRLRKQNSLITWERNDLRQFVDSCQKEFTMTSSAALDMQQLSKIEALEKALEGYKKRNDQLEKEISQGYDQMSCSGSLDRDSAEFTRLKTERDNLFKEKEALLKKIDDLEYQIEHRSLKGDFDTRQTKILHLRTNPISEASSSYTSDIEKYQAEIARLRERVKLLQEGNMHNLTQIVDERVNVNAGKEISDLKEKLCSQEKQNQRLRDAFKMTSQEFREAINLLLGYKVDALPNKQYRLLNFYAETPDQHLIFKMNQNGVMDLLETPFSDTVGDLIEVHLQQENSIPVFLSALTMQLFQKQTICESNQQSDDTEIILSD